MIVIRIIVAFIAGLFLAVFSAGFADAAKEDGDFGGDPYAIGLLTGALIAFISFLIIG